MLGDVGADEVRGGVAECAAISRTDPHEVLRGALADGVTRLGVAVTAVEPSGRVVLDDGSTRTYDLVVGADGIDSAVRADVRPRFPARSAGGSSWTAASRA
ncbi:hypothetical protein [Umezawaea sp.]|uniref:hypothetical protein n=1 Tax=Umezawaea sp. TaxID=1955258 RepID=UPI002ED02FAC